MINMLLSSNDLYPPVMVCISFFNIFLGYDGDWEGDKYAAGHLLKHSQVWWIGHLQSTFDWLINSAMDYENQ